MRREGYHSLFEQKQAAYLAQYRQFRKPDFTDPMHNREFQYLAEIIESSVQHDCPLVLFIYPYHADYLDMLHRLGLWPGFEAWKRAILQTVDQHAGTRRNLIRVFDFSDYNDVTTERVPPPGDRVAQMQWYWEPGHFKSALGDRIIARIVGNDDDFGRELTNASINSVLCQINVDQMALSADAAPSGIDQKR